MQGLDLRAMAMALFLPLLFWTGAVLTVSMMGYPGIACMTPAAWLLALPVGLRVRRDSESAGRRLLLEAALAGGLLGLGQGLIFATVVAASPYLPGLPGMPGMPNALYTALLSLVPGILVTTGLSAAVAVVKK